MVYLFILLCVPRITIIETVLLTSNFLLLLDLFVCLFVCLLYGVFN